VQAFNKVWENTGTGNYGTCRSPVMCRNITNDGFVTASFWVHPGKSGADKYQITVIETDDAGAIVRSNSVTLVYNIGPPPLNIQSPAEEIELVKIMIDPISANNRYVLMGIMHNPANPSQAGSFFIAPNSTLGIHTANPAKILSGGIYHFWDFAIAPLSGDIVICGFTNGDQALSYTSRKSVLAVADSAFASQSTYEMASASPSGTYPRFECAKTIDIYQVSGVEKVVIAGNKTAQVGTFPNYEYVPLVFLERLTLASHTLSNSSDWIVALTSTTVTQMIPSDLVIDYANNQVMVVGCVSYQVGAGKEACYWAVNLTTGAGNKYGQFQGSITAGPPISFSQLRPYHIMKTPNGANYKISGWVDNYNDGTVRTAKYNFFEITINPTNYTFSNLNGYLGNTKFYSGLFSTSFFGVLTSSLSYTYSGLSCLLYVYHVPSFSLTWDDGGTDRTCWAWVNIPDDTDLNRHQMRIKSTKSGGGDGGNCDAFNDTPDGSASNTTQDELFFPWSSVDIMLISTRPRITINLIIPDAFNCYGNYN
jgi:hypothetical protein